MCLPLLSSMPSLPYRLPILTNNMCPMSVFAHYQICVVILQNNLQTGSQCLQSGAYFYLPYSYKIFGKNKTERSD